MVYKIADIASIRLNDIVTLKKKISEDSIAAFTNLTGDDNPLHIDEEFAKTTEFKGRVAHGMLSAAYISTVIGTMLPGPGALWLSQDISFLKPVRVGDEIEIVVTVINISFSTRVVSLTTDIFNQKGLKVLEGKAKVKLLDTVRIKPNASDEQRVALVTGGSRGIGAAIARNLSADGMSVVINFKNRADEAERLVEEILESGGKAIAIQADLSSRDEIEKLIDKAILAFGRIDVLVNNASGPVVFKKFEDTDWPMVQEHISLQVEAAFHLCSRLVPGMIEKKFGRIINIITSNVERTRPLMTDYTIAKAALMGLSKCLAVELGPHGVTVNMVSPGMTDTELIDDVSQRVKLLMASNSPLRRIGSPEDVAGIVTFLAGLKASHITGANIPVCGGYVMQG